MYKCFDTVNRGPAKKPATASGSSGAKPKPKGNPAVEGQEPTWDLGKMKMVKVSRFPLPINSRNYVVLNVKSSVFIVVRV